MSRPRVVPILVALAVGLGAGPSHALACLVDVAERPMPAESPCHGPANDEHPADHGNTEAPAPAGPSVACCTAAPAVVRAADRAPATSSAVLAPLSAMTAVSPAVTCKLPHAVRPPAPPGALHLLHGCFRT